MKIELDTLKNSIGRKVSVRDGTPQPPKHHSRKLAKWESHNFDGTLERIEEPDYMSYPMVVVGMDARNIPGCVSFSNCVPAAWVVAILPQAEENAA